MTTTAFPFPRLALDNFDRWCIQMRTFLGGQDVWDAVEIGVEELLVGVTNSKQQREIRTRDQKALSILQQGVDDVNFERIASATTAKVAWDLLKRAFKGDVKVKRVRLQALRGDMDRLRQADGESIAQYCSRVRAVVNALRQNGETVEEVRVLEKVLRSLLPTFDHIVVAIEGAKDLDEMTMEDLCGSLQAHEEMLSRRKQESLDQALHVRMKITETSEKSCQADRGASSSHRGKHGRGRGFNGGRSKGGRGSGSGRGRNYENVDSERQAKTHDRSRVKCYNCQRFGHYAKECYASNTVRGNANVSEQTADLASKHGERVTHESSLLLVCANTVISGQNWNAWCLDTGASNHMCETKVCLRSWMNRLKGQ